MRSLLLVMAMAPCLVTAAAAPRDIRELQPAATIPLGKTADWVIIDGASVWVGSTGPFAVHRIDPKTNRVEDVVALPGAPCAGLALGFGSLWVPLCTRKPSLARVDLVSRRAEVFPVGPAADEGGIAVAGDSVWLVIDKGGTLARIDPATGTVRATVKVPAGSYNPHTVGDTVWVTQVEGSLLSGVDARTGRLLAPAIKVGPHPRFLTSGSGAVWTLNQGDGSVTRFDLRSHATQRLALDTPGHGGDIAHYAGLVISTMMKMPVSLIDADNVTLLCQWAGPGGDSLGLGFGSLWLTDYHGGTVSRVPLADLMDQCDSRLRQRHPLAEE